MGGVWGGDGEKERSLEGGGLATKTNVKAA